MRHNRFKQTKQKQHKRQKKQTKQTKHKRRMQYGGKTYKYGNYSELLKTDAPHKTVVIPGYLEISDMIKEYIDSVTIQNQLDAGIKSKNVVVYTSCEEIPSTPDTTIILLKKDGLLSFASSSIDCDDETYLSLASHNFQIFIKDILKWNPFLPNNNHKKTEEPSSRNGSRHSYNQSEVFSYRFTQPDWWNLQQWWNAYKLTLPTYAILVPTPTLPLRPRLTPIATESSPQEPRDDVSLMDEPTLRINLRVLTIHLDGLKSQVIKLQKENQDLIDQISQLTRGETKKYK
jgi:hypothetical protein